MPHYQRPRVFWSKTALWSLRLSLLLAAVLGGLQIGGCYYLQAVNGQMEILRKRTPISEVIEDPESSEQLKLRLAMVQEARQFATEEMLLPDNNSYQTFADLGRDFVVWNVIAAPEFSLQAKTWCYPVVGCVAYRGYFSEKAARKHADKLRADGYDVFVGGVAAYSTLGRFADPVLNTMMHWSDVSLIAVLFHELAHQQLFIKGDTGFNESFATAVEEIGVERWLRSRGQQSEIAEYHGRGELQETMMALVEGAKTELEVLYMEDSGDEMKRDKKQEILDRLSNDAELAVARQPVATSNWLKQPLNNARLVSLVLYRGQLDTFRILLKDCKDEMVCFYKAAEDLAHQK